MNTPPTTHVRRLRSTVRHLRAAVLAIAVATSRQVAAQPTAGVHAVLDAQIGHRVRLWTSTGAAATPAEGQVQLLSDSSVTVLLLDDVHHVDLRLASIDRVAVPRARSAAVLPAAVFGGMVVGGALGYGFRPLRGPEKGEEFVGRLYVGIGGAILGMVVGYFASEKLVSAERWVTLFARPTT